MKTLVSIVLALLLGASLAQAKEKIVTTLPSLGSVAREVGGDRVDVVVLAKAGQDPHFVDAKPSFMVEMRNADLFIVDGLELEIGWVPPLLEGCRNANIQTGASGYLDASSFVSVIDLPTGAVDRSMGDVHALGNPHYGIDPIALRRVAAGIAERLSGIDVEGGKTYSANLKAYQRKIDDALFGNALVEEVGGSKLARLVESGEFDKWVSDNKLTEKVGGWMKDMAPLKGKEVVSYHTSMNYFWARFGMKLAATVEPKPGIPASASHSADVILLMRERKIGLVVTQPFYDESPVKMITEKTGARSVSVPLEGDDALATIGNIVRQVSGAAK
ncbi:MAG: zinc ABC transporter substrate-binding protein [Planctomycetes bacterium]|nr:zinc ABC transporter substrate-binding protein [Planctomycetota bacterium]